MATERIYLDNSATTPVDPAVIEAMLPFLREDFGNASSVHGFGQRARAALESARHQVANLIGVSAGEIVFTSGGTESDNLAIKGAANALRDRGRHIVTTVIEHPAVLKSCQELARQGFEITYLPVNTSCLVTLDQVMAAVRDDTILVSLMAANNEIGTILPVAEVGAALTKLRGDPNRSHPYLHTDAVQAVGKIPVSARHWQVDLLSLSGHKIHAPKGVGALYVRKGIRIVAQSHGGHHERAHRAGTENVPGAVALGKAAELARLHLPQRMEHTCALRDHLEQEIERQVPHVVVNGDRERRLPSISNCSFRFIDGEGLLIRLDLKGIAVSTGAACASGSVEPSHVLLALGHDAEIAHGSIRFSIGKDNTREEIDRLLTILPAEVEKLRAVSPQYARA